MVAAFIPPKLKTTGLRRLSLSLSLSLSENSMQFGFPLVSGRCNKAARCYEKRNNRKKTERQKTERERELLLLLLHCCFTSTVNI